MKTPADIIRRSYRTPIALLAAVGFFFSLPLDAGAARWEYMAVSANLNNRNLEALLNNYGQQGWELVQITPKGAAVFKRIRRG